MDLKDVLDGNPFFVLELPSAASPSEVQKQGQKLLGMLAVDMTSAKTYRIDDQEYPRDEHNVRWAMGELQDPTKRVIYELWALPGGSIVELEAQKDAAPQRLLQAHTLRWWNPFDESPDKGESSP